MTRTVAGVSVAIDVHVRAAAGDAAPHVAHQAGGEQPLAVARRGARVGDAGDRADRRVRVRLVAAAAASRGDGHGERDRCAGGAWEAANQRRAGATIGSAPRRCAWPLSASSSTSSTPTRSGTRSRRCTTASGHHAADPSARDRGRAERAHAGLAGPLVPVRVARLRGRPPIPRARHAAAADAARVGLGARRPPPPSGPPARALPGPARLLRGQRRAPRRPARADGRRRPTRRATGAIQLLAAARCPGTRDLGEGRGSRSCRPGRASARSTPPSRRGG